MSSVAEAFTLVSLGKVPSVDGQMLTHRITSGYPGAIFAALDSAGERHLLIQAAVSEMKPDRSSQGVSLGSRKLVLGGTTRHFVDLHCRMESLALVFERLAADVISRLNQLPPVPADEVCRKTLHEWRDLLRKAATDLPTETLLGITGELEILRILWKLSPHALEAWVGPTRSIHDFAWKGRELEVKTTASVDGSTVSISNLDQLDPSPITELLLAVVHLRRNSAGPNLDDRITSLIDLGLPRHELLTKVEDSGYVFESGSDRGQRFSTSSVRIWEVTEDFPGLRRGEMPETWLKGVGKVSYQLNLDALPPMLDKGASGRALGRLFGEEG